MKYMLDTDTCIYVIKEKPKAVIERLRRAELEDLCLSAITLCELEFGVSKSALPETSRRALAGFLAPLHVAAFDERAAQEYGQLRAALERAGTVIGSMDMLIAAHALSLRCALVTNNEAEFTRVPRLRVLNWARPEGEKA